VNGGANGDGSTRGGGGATTGADGGASRIMFVSLPPIEGPGPGMKIGDGDFLSFVIRLLKRFRSPSRNF